MDTDNTTPPNPDDGSRRGRPPKLTDELIAAAAALLLQGNFRCVVAGQLGLHPATFRRWMRTGRRFPGGIYARFRSAVVAAEAQAEARAVAAVVAAGQDDPAHLEWFLERKFPQRWGRYRGELGELKRRLKELEKVIGEAPDATPS